MSQVSKNLTSRRSHGSPKPITDFHLQHISGYTGGFCKNLIGLTSRLSTQQLICWSGQHVETAAQQLSNIPAQRSDVSSRPRHCSLIPPNSRPRSIRFERSQDTSLFEMLDHLPRSARLFVPACNCPCGCGAASQTQPREMYMIARQSYRSSRCAFERHRYC